MNIIDRINTGILYILGAALAVVAAAAVFVIFAGLIVTAFGA